jgi:hypothetical protein
MRVLDGVYHLAVVLVSGHCLNRFFQAIKKIYQKSLPKQA